MAKPLSRRETYRLIAGLAFGWVIVFGGISAINPLLPFVRAEFQLSGSEAGLPASCKTDMGKPLFKAPDGGRFEVLWEREDLTQSGLQRG